MRQISAMDIKLDFLIDVGTCIQSEKIVQSSTINNSFLSKLFKWYYLVIKEENCRIFLDYKYHVEIEPDSLL